MSLLRKFFFFFTGFLIMTLLMTALVPNQSRHSGHKPVTMKTTVSSGSSQTN